MHETQHLSSILASSAHRNDSFNHFAIVTVTLRHANNSVDISPPVLTAEEVRLVPVVRVTSRPNTDNSEGEGEETGYRARNIVIVDVRADRHYWGEMRRRK